MNSCRLRIITRILLSLSLFSCNHISNPAAPSELAGNLAEKGCRIEIVHEYPVLTVTNEYIDPIISSKRVSGPPILEVPAALPVEFCWTAEPSQYGDKVKAYRYGWDITDIDDPSLWAIEFTPLKKRGACAPQQKFFFGTHTFHVEVVDEAGRKAYVMIILNIAPYPIFFDLMPGNCPNSLNPKKKGIIQVAIPSSPGFDLHSIDTSTLELWIDGNIVLPATVFFEDVTSPAIFHGDCDCYEGRRDGVDDLVLKFSAQEVIQALGSVSRDEVKTIYLRGFGLMGLPLDMRDCVIIVGNPPTSEDDRGDGNHLSQ
ncbi:MAG: hypothetical protein GTO29_11685 [Candidatus Latescibacteria bacterium]|nr:hypothetical protein [Candidatus Latescibacterota bacterium]NIO56827.1 hypothetical protein [Candidatus Latescibacterota bacterium]